MDTQVRTPQALFTQAQRFVVPLFQRPYVWNRELQWEPLWDDLARVASHVLREPAGAHRPHFLGAVVLQQVPNKTSELQRRVIIDGQQRLTTLQVLLDALHAELLALGEKAPARRIEILTTNEDAYRINPEDRFKVWPTNRDQPSFSEVMVAVPPVQYDGLKHAAARLPQAHRYFGEEIRAWLHAGGQEQQHARAEAIERAARDLLQIVVIDLGAEENAQEIFETLNARGAQLTAADLIKNLVFQQLRSEADSIERLYVEYWEEFETAFWEAPVAARHSMTRASSFLSHWLVSQVVEEIPSREIFTRFKRFATESERPMLALLSEIKTAAAVYRRFIESASSTAEQLTNDELFAYRSSVIDSDSITPLILWAFSASPSAIPDPQRQKFVNVLSSWLVRRMIVRATTKSYAAVVVDALRKLKSSPRETAGDTLEAFFLAQTASSAYWPDDSEVKHELETSLIYKRMGRGRLRMLLEAVEDHLRGYTTESAFRGQRVERDAHAIEHVMPRAWEKHWPLDSRTSDEERNKLVHTLGNLTLLRSRLNGSVSNRPWTSKDSASKRSAIEEHDVLLLNRRLLSAAGDKWDDDKIRTRTSAMADIVNLVWPAPPGTRRVDSAQRVELRRRPGLDDLIAAGYLSIGAALYSKRKRFQGPIATVTSDGRIDVGGTLYDAPSAAATAITGAPTNGREFFHIESAAGANLNDLFERYSESLDVATVDTLSRFVGDADSTSVVLPDGVVISGEEDDE